MKYGEVEKNWVWMLGLGLIFITLGTAGLMILPLLSITSVAVFGAFMIAGGILQTVQGITKAKEWKSRTLHIVMGAIYVLGGIFAVINPVLATAIYALFLGLALIFIGFLRIAVAFQNRDVSQWALMSLSGILTVFLGLMIVLQWPWSSLWAVGLFISTDMILAGANYIAIALAAKTERDAGTRAIMH
ncbi:hded protein [Thermococcus profundus]|uniref:Hded protein n=1 Tax=Thermococcus profundus TaxID=49899 RepID=A0A2Z2MG16_THEPR|nr:DUF308 domain-containing protein [Thermococcus profundus]ASJ03665.1 hded protein [Thermococcus profundus]